MNIRDLLISQVTSQASGDLLPEKPACPLPTKQEIKASLLKDIVNLKNFLTDARLNNFEINSRVKLHARFRSSRQVYTKDQLLTKRILSLIHVIDVIRKHTKNENELQRIKEFLELTKNCLEDIIGFQEKNKSNFIQTQTPLLQTDFPGENAREQEKNKAAAINARVQRYLKDTQCYRNFPKKRWRNLTRPILNLCKSLNSVFTTSLESIGLFAKPASRHVGLDKNYDWRDLGDKANQLADFIRNTR